jgi:AraC-like DNA-binding protein
MKVRIVPAPANLKEDVECFRIVEYNSEEDLAITVCINGMPGIVFQHHQGHSPLQSITTRLGSHSFHGKAPTLFVYGQNTERGVMNQAGPFTMTQVILKPHALRTVLGVNASELTRSVVGLSEFSGEDLNGRLLEAKSEQERVNLLTNFIACQRKRVKCRDEVVESSLRLIQENVRTIRVNSLLEELNISESHFERRFLQTVGVTPQFYIRVKRFNEAIGSIKTRRFARLTDVAHDLNFYDQSHFIRDTKEFSGLTPKSLSQKQDDFHYDQGGYFYF